MGNLCFILDRSGVNIQTIVVRDGPASVVAVALCHPVCDGDAATSAAAATSATATSAATTASAATTQHTAEGAARVCQRGLARCSALVLLLTCRLCGHRYGAATEAVQIPLLTVAIKSQRDEIALVYSVGKLRATADNVRSGVFARGSIQQLKS